jgi:hypothetical protein
MSEPNMKKIDTKDILSNPDTYITNPGTLTVNLETFVVSVHDGYTPGGLPIGGGTVVTPGGTSGAVQMNWQGTFTDQGGTPADTYSTLKFDGDGIPTLNGTSAYQQRVNNSPYLQIFAPRVESEDFAILAGPGIVVIGYDDTYNTPRSAYLSVQNKADATQQWDFGIIGNGDDSFSIRNRTTNTIALSIDNTSGDISGGNLVTWTAVPSTNTSSGTPGQAAYDASGNLYVCVATDTWSKIAGTTSW